MLARALLVLASTAAPVVAQAKLYHIANGFGADDVMRSDLNGANVESVLRGLTFPQDLSVDLDGGKVYWSDFNSIWRGNLDGSGGVEAIASGGTTRGVAVDPAGGKVYWTEYNPAGKIRRANLDGSSPETLVTAGLNIPTHLALDVFGGKMYWTDLNDQQVQRANLDGSDVEDLHAEPAYGIAVDTVDGKLYWSNAGNFLRRSELDGSDPVTVFTTGGQMRGIDVDPFAGWVYFAQLNPSRISRVRTDGSGLEFLIQPLDTPLGVDVDRLFCPSTETYCTAGISGAGCAAALSATGRPSAVSPSGFVVAASGVEGGRNGLLFFGVNGRQAAPWGNGTSYRCVVPPVARGALLLGTGTSGQCDGALSQDLNALWAAKPAVNPGPGSVAQAQLWYRDPLNTSNRKTSLSDALELTVCP